jgi:hypothetical protein
MAVEDVWEESSVETLKSVCEMKTAYDLKALYVL